MMMQAEHEIGSQVLAAKQDSSAADEFIQKYMGFIHSETTKFLHRAAGSEHEDELSIAMFAFYEAIINYQRGKGAFLSYAARAIRNRLIDYYRKEKRHTNTISIHTPTGIDDESELADTLRDEKDELHQAIYRQATQAEIQEFAAQLGEFGVSLSDVAQNSPKQQRTLQACCRILDYAKQNPHLLHNWCKQSGFPWQSFLRVQGWIKRRWNGIENIWWRFCLHSQMDTKLFVGTYAR